LTVQWEGCLESIFRNSDKNFGNAGEVEKLISEIIKNYVIRKPEDEPQIKFILNDIPKNYLELAKDAKDPSKSALAQLEELIALESVKSQIHKFLKRQEAHKENPNLSKGSKYHMIFQGNPGTGKTTVARIISEIFKERGFLEKGHLIEVKRQDLVAGYIGQTAIKTQKVIEDAMGGVLFIDEAYSLSRSQSQNDFGQEAIDTILTAMSDHADNLCVICAGYPEPMKTFLESNEGLTRRIGAIIDFEDYNPIELFEILEFNKLKQKFSTTAEFDEISQRIFKVIYSKRNKNFGNAGEVENYIKDVQDNWIERCQGALNQMPIDACDIPQKYLDLIGEARQALQETESEIVNNKTIKVSIPKSKYDQTINHKVNDHIGLLTGIIKSDGGVGTGFTISPQGHVMTCYHVIEEANNWKIRFNEKEKEYNLDLLAFSKESDIAVLKIREKLDHDLPFARILPNSYAISLGEKIAMQGFPEGEKHSSSVHYSEGTIMNTDTKNEIRNAFSIDVTAKQGNSGSAIYLRETGEVIGVLFGKPHGFDSILCTSQVSIHQLVRFILSDEVKKEEKRQQHPNPIKDEKKITDGKKYTIKAKRHSYIDKVNIRAKKIKSSPENLIEFDCDKIYIDSNIWFFSAKKQFKGALFQSLITLAAACKVLNNKIIVTSTVYNELVSIKDNKEDSRNRDAAITISTISQLAESDLLEYDGILGIAPEEINYADPPFIEKSVKALDQENSIMVISGDNDVRQRSRNLLKDKKKRLNLKSKHKVLTPSELISFSMDLSEKLKGQ